MKDVRRPVSVFALETLAWTGLISSGWLTLTAGLALSASLGG